MKYLILIYHTDTVQPILGEPLSPSKYYEWSSILATKMELLSALMYSGKNIK